MPVRVEGGAQLRELSIRLKAADRALLLKMRRDLRALAKPATEAVKREELAVLPKRGGLNEWVASAKIGVRILTGPKSAGVRLVQGRTSHGGLSRSNLRKAEREGLVRHPVYGHRDRKWQDTEVPSGWWERPLLGMAPEARAAMKRVMKETARTAGFRRF